VINRRFTLLWTGQTVSNLGDRITELAIPLLAVTVLTATPEQVGLLTAAVWAPHLLGVLVGSWADRRRHPRRSLIAADLLRAAALFSLPIAHWTGLITLTQLFAVALITGLGEVLAGSAYQPFFVTLVDRHQYVEANSKLSVSRSASYVAGPAAGGFLVQAFTAPVAILADALSFLVSAALIGRIQAPERPAPDGPRASLITDAREGLRYVFAHPYLRAALGCVTTVNFFTFIAQAVLILFASRTLGLPGGLIGLAIGIGATGGLLGALLAPRLSRRYGVGRVALFGSVLFPAPLGLLALAHGPHALDAAVIVVVEALSATGVMLLDINLNAVQAAVTADHLRSRVAGVFGTINYGVRPVGAVLGGVLGGSVGVRPTLIIAAAGGALCGLWLLRSPIPGTRRVDDDLALAA
jgi:MFS family permease